jgi:hypothetical protein
VVALLGIALSMIDDEVVFMVNVRGWRNEMTQAAARKTQASTL